MFASDIKLVLRVSNGIAIMMLVITGFWLGRLCRTCPVADGSRNGHSWERSGRNHQRRGRTRIKQSLTALTLVGLLASPASGQVTSISKPDSSRSSASSPWSFSFTAGGYVVPHSEFFVSPIVTADRDWLHFEGRYNYENQQTGSLWIGYNFSVGRKLVFEATPMIGGIFGNTAGVAPGYEVSLSYKRIVLSSSGEYVFDTKNQNGSFFYSWPELIYSPLDWLHIGLVAQRTKAYHTSFDTQRGLLVGVSHKEFEFTTFILNPGWSDPTLILELRWSF
jgi:hypothetical protein